MSSTSTTEPMDIRKKVQNLLTTHTGYQELHSHESSRYANKQTKQKIATLNTLIIEDRMDDISKIRLFEKNALEKIRKLKNSGAISYPSWIEEFKQRCRLEDKDWAIKELDMLNHRKKEKAALKEESNRLAGKRRRPSSRSRSPNSSH